MSVSKNATLLAQRYYCCQTVAMVICMLLSFGCGAADEMAMVHGTVTLEGSPVEGAVVAFLPEAGGRPSTGRTQSDGSFEMTANSQGDGVMIGAYRVTVTAVEEEGGGDAQEDELGSFAELRQAAAPEPRWRTPQKYADVDTSGLQFEVKAGEENIANFDLKKQ